MWLRVENVDCALVISFLSSCCLLLDWTWKLMCIVLFKHALLLLIEELERLQGMAEEDILGIKDDCKTSCVRFNTSIDVEDSILLVLVLNGQINFIRILNGKLKHLRTEFFTKCYFKIDIFGSHLDLVNVLFFALVKIKLVAICFSLHVISCPCDYM